MWLVRRTADVAELSNAQVWLTACMRYDVRSEDCLCRVPREPREMGWPGYLSLEGFGCEKGLCEVCGTLVALLHCCCGSVEWVPKRGVVPRPMCIGILPHLTPPYTCLVWEGSMTCVKLTYALMVVPSSTVYLLLTVISSLLRDLPHTHGG